LCKKIFFIQRNYFGIEKTIPQSAMLIAVSSPDSVSAKRVMADHSAPFAQGSR